MDLAVTVRSSSYEVSARQLRTSLLHLISSCFCSFMTSASNPESDPLNLDNVASPLPLHLDDRANLAPLQIRRTLVRLEDTIIFCALSLAR